MKDTSKNSKYDSYLRSYTQGKFDAQSSRRGVSPKQVNEQYQKRGYSFRFGGRFPKDDEDGTSELSESSLGNE